MLLRRGICRKQLPAWVAEIERLSSIAKTEPHAVHAAFTHGILGHWLYLVRSVDGIAHLLQPVEDAIRLQLLPAITGRAGLSDDERDLIALPARLGGLGMADPTTLSEEYTFSLQLSAPLIALIIQQSDDLGDYGEQQHEIRADLRNERHARQNNIAATVKSRLPYPSACCRTNQ